MASTIQVRVDDELKVKSDELFRDLWCLALLVLRSLMS